MFRFFPPSLTQHKFSLTFSLELIEISLLPSPSHDSHLNIITYMCVLYLLIILCQLWMQWPTVKAVFPSAAQRTLRPIAPTINGISGNNFNGLSLYNPSKIDGVSFVCAFAGLLLPFIFNLSIEFLYLTHSFFCITVVVFAPYRPYNTYLFVVLRCSYILLLRSFCSFLFLAPQIECWIIKSNKFESIAYDKQLCSCLTNKSFSTFLSAFVVGWAVELLFAS